MTTVESLNVVKAATSCFFHLTGAFQRAMNMTAYGCPKLIE